MKNKYLIIISLVAWADYALFYLLSLYQIETVLIGVFRELMILPSLICGVVCPIWLIVKIILKMIKPN